MKQVIKRNLFEYSKQLLSGNIMKTLLMGIITTVFLGIFSVNAFAADSVNVVVYDHVTGQLGAEIDAFMVGKGTPNEFGWYDNINSLTVSGGSMNGVDFGVAHDPDGKYSGLKKAGDRRTLTSVDFSGTSFESDTLSDSAFWYAQNLTTITLPDGDDKGVKIIENCAFGYCESLIDFNFFPDSVTTIGKYVFMNCSGLTSVTIPAGVTKIDEYLFTYGMDGTTPAVKDVYMLSSNPSSIDVKTNSFYAAFAMLHVPDGSIGAYYGDTRDGDTTDRKWFELYINDPDRAPVIKGVVVRYVTETDAQIYFTSDFPGQYYYAVVDDGAAAPDIDTSGAGTAINNSLSGYYELTGLTNTAKDIYFVVKDCNGKISNKLKMDVPAYDAAPVNIAITGHAKGKLADEINAKLIESGMGYNYDKLGRLTVSGGIIGSDDADYINDNLYKLEAVDFSGTSFESNTVQGGFLEWSDTLKTVILPDSVETIGDGAFYELAALESITLGSSTPPVVGTDVFSTLPGGGAAIYVPSGSKAAYLAVNDGDTTDDKWYGLTVKETAAVTYTISYNGNGGTGTAPTEGNKTAGATFAAAANSFIAPSGKQFKEWNTNPGGTETSYAAGATVIMTASNLTLYAVWEDIPATTYTVTYDSNGGTGTAPTEPNKAVGATFAAAANSFTAPSGKQFKEWNTNPGGTGTSYAAGATVTMPASNLILYAIWATTVTASTDQTIPISGPANISVPQGITGAKIDIDPANPLPLIKVNVSTAFGTIQTEIPDGATVSGPAGWNGEITLPTVKASPSASITGAQTIDTVIEVGLGNEIIKFSKAVRLLVPNMAGKSAGFVRNGVFTPITATISADSQSAADAEIPDGGEAKINVGNDLVIWTKHFTEFVAYTPAAVISSGGGGGGGSASQYINTTTGSATVYPTAGGKIGLGSDAIVEIPANALQGTSGVTVKVQKVESPASIPAGFKSESDVFEFSVDSKTSYSFNKPVTITLKLNTAAGSIPAIYYYDSQSSKWIKVGGTVSGSTISVPVDHFTQYTVLAENQPQPSTANQPNSFTDLDKHWAKPFADKLAGLGAVSGYPDGSFKPDAPITRAEFVAILVKALKLTANGNGPAFKDTTGHWANSSISVAAESGLIKGYGDNCFKPDSTITREEMAVIAVKAIKLQQAGGETSFTDNARLSPWAKDSMKAIVNNNIMTGYPDNTIRPQGNTTRAEAVTVIVKLR